MLSAYLSRLGFTDREVKIYVVLAELGIQPASVIARRSGMDRVTTYKHLRKLALRGFVQTYFRDGVQCFGIENFDALESTVSEQVEDLKEMHSQFPTLLNVLRSLRGGEDSIPKLQLFEGDAGMQALFRDMLHELKESGLKQIRGLSVNTLEEWVSDENISKAARQLFQDLRERKVNVELFEITGGLVPEQVKKVAFKELDLRHLPIARGTTSVFVVGSAVYMASYKGGQVGLKMQQNELSQIFHFIFDLLQRRA